MHVTFPEVTCRSKSIIGKLVDESIVLKTFRADVHNLRIDIETVTSDPFYLPIVFE